MRRSGALVVMALLVAASWAPAVAAGEGTPLFHFAILSDRTGGHVEGVYPRVIEEIARMNPDFVVTVGDQIEGYIEDMELASAQWDTILAMIAGLEAPVYLTPGNHDIWSDASRDLYIERTGQEPYYSFDRDGVHFVVLDNSMIESWSDLRDAQREWLVSDLEANREAKRTFVFAHKPLWASTLAMGQPDALHEILVRHGVDAVFCGHLHHYFSGEYDGIRYVTVGSSGGGMYRNETEPIERGEFFQFAWVTVTENDHEVAIVHLGNIYGEDVSTIDNEREIERIENEHVSSFPVRIGEGDEEWFDSTVRIVNASDRPIAGSLVWDVPPGWVVEPETLPLEIASGEEGRLPFRASNPGPLYPAPRFSFDYPLSNGRDLTTDIGMSIRRLAVASRLPRAPTIDGELDEACWQRLAPVVELYPPYEDARIADETQFLFGRDGESLYLAAVCHDARVDEIVAAAAERDGAVYRDDCVGYFFCPDAGEGVVYQVYVNAAGVIFDQRIAFDDDGRFTADTAWDGAIEVATRRTGGAWTFEARLPFSEVGADPDAPCWSVNFRRKQARGGRAADWQVPIDYDPGTFGELRME